MSELVVGSLKGLSANSFVIDVASGSTLDLSAGAVLPSGSVIQVLSTTKTDTFSTSSTSFAAVTGLSVSITPSATSSKILVLASVHQGGSGSGGERSGFSVFRDSTNLIVPTSPGSRNIVASWLPWLESGGVNSGHMFTFAFLDSPNTTSAIAYNVQALAQSGGTVFINRSSTDTDNAEHQRSVSGITVMEIAG